MSGDGRKDAAPRAAASGGLVERVLASYADVRASMARVLADRPSDAVLFSLLVMAAFIGLLGDAFEIFANRAVESGPAASDPAVAAERFREEIGTAFVARMLLFPIAVYLAAGALLLAARPFGGTGGGYESRAAMIWALLVAAPLTLALSGLQAVGVGAGLADASGPAGISWRGLVTLASLGVGLYALYIWGACVAEAHGFRSVARVMAAALAVLAGIAALWIGASTLSA